jgi:hypothetical protein
LSVEGAILKGRDYFGEGSVALVFNEAGEGDSKGKGGFLLEHAQNGIIEVIINLESTLETLMVLVGVDEPLTAFSANEPSPVAHNLYFEHVPVDGDWFPRAAEVNVVHDQFSGLLACLGHELCELQLA